MTDSECVSYKCCRSLQHVSERVVTAPTKEEKSAETKLEVTYSGVW